MKRKKIRIFLCATLMLVLFGVSYCTVENGFILDAPRKLTFNEAKGPYKGVGVYIINLDRSKERYAYVKSYADKLGLPVKRITAVDGKKLSDAYIKKNVDAEIFCEYYHMPTKGTIGCYLSHVKAWETFLKSNFEYALIFEDDVSFDPLKLRHVVNELIKNHRYWDINTFETCLPWVEIKSLGNSLSLGINLRGWLNAAAYMINRKAAHRLLEKALPIKMPLDHYYTRTWELGLKFTGIIPCLVHQTFGDTDIGYRPNNHDSSVKYILYNISCRNLKWLYNFMCYLKNRLIEE